MVRQKEWLGKMRSKDYLINYVVQVSPLNSNNRPKLMTVMIAQPHTSSAIHHHSTQDTIIYAIRGHGAVISEGGKTRQPLGPGDWALIPAGVEHQEVNDGDEEVVWAITRGGKTALVENIDGWAK